MSAGAHQTADRRPDALDPVPQRRSDAVAGGLGLGRRGRRLAGAPGGPAGTRIRAGPLPHLPRRGPHGSPAPASPPRVRRSARRGARPARPARHGRSGRRPRQRFRLRCWRAALAFARRLRSVDGGVARRRVLRPGPRRSAGATRRASRAITKPIPHSSTTAAADRDQDRFVRVACVGFVVELWSSLVVSVGGGLLRRPSATVPAASCPLRDPRPRRRRADIIQRQPGRSASTAPARERADAPAAASRRYARHPARIACSAGMHAGARSRPSGRGRPRGRRRAP